MSEEKCCVVKCESPLDQAYWDNQYAAQSTGWDLGKVSPPIQTYVDGLTDKTLAVLIPGCGNTYEAEYLLSQGFSNITVIDIAPTLVATLQEKFADNPNIRVVLGDFFEHEGKYDLIIEQTFFCALPPTLRQKYVWKMHQLLAPQGKLAGLLFNRDFEVSPPFGGSVAEYEQLFGAAFVLNRMATATNSVAARATFELQFEFTKNNAVVVSLYAFSGITCTGCKATVSGKFMEIEGVLQVSMSTDFSEVLLVSKAAVALETLEALIAYDENYSIRKLG